MTQHVEQRETSWNELREKVIGLGSSSSRKSYYPELQQRLKELEDEVARRKQVEQELKLKSQKLEQEIIERLNIEDDLRRERDNTRAVFEAAPVGMLLLNGTCRILDANQAMSVISGMECEQMLGMFPGQALNCAYVQPGTAECGHTPECAVCGLRSMVRAVIQARVGHYGVEIKHLKRSGNEPQTMWLKVSVEPISISGESCAILAIDDLTERHNLEDELMRTRKLESLGVLAGGIAHDYNNLLAGIVGNLSLALMRIKDRAELATPVERALQATERAADLTRQLLTFAKGGAPVKQLASLEKIIRDSAEFVLRGANVRCECSIADDLWPAEVDIGQISQVISNLVINADQAMPDGGTILLKAENEESADYGQVECDRWVRITVEDQGVGIRPEHLSRIFDPYFSTKQHGSGLGLATVHSIVTRHGGTIRASSLPGVGTRFVVLLPASRQALEVSSRAEDRITHGNGRILVMDDEQIIREMAADMLDLLGYRADVCASGDDACRIYQDALVSGDRFAAVIMDLTIPGGMGGVAAMKRILALDPKARGIVSSGYSNDPVVADFRGYGFCAAVPKPFSVKAMADTLSSVLNS